MPQDLLPQTDHVNMLIQLLLRFPEIHTITLNLPSSTCRLTYMIRQKLNREKCPALRQHLQESLKTFCYLNQCKTDHRLTIDHESYHHLTQLRISLGYDMLLGEIISLFTAIIRDLFPEDLIAENRAGNDPQWSESNFVEERPVPESGSERRSNHLIAFRDSGKVYIFDR